MRKVLIFCTLLAGWSFSSFAQDTLTLDQAVAVGLENNYSIRIARNSEQIAKNSNTLGNAGFLPDVGLNFSNTNGITNSRAELASGGVREGNGVRTHNTQANAMVNWRIFDGFNMFVTKNRLEELQRVGESEARMNVENTLSQIIITYYAIVQQEKMLGVIREAIDLSVQRLKLAEAKKSVGAGSEQAILQAQVDANADSTRYYQQLGIIRNTKSDLNRLLARDVRIAFEVKDNLSVNPHLKIEELQNGLLSQNAQLLIQRANANIAGLNVDSYRSLYYPQVNVFGGYTYSKNQTPVGAVILSQSNGFTYGLTASFNIFNGGISRLNVQNAKIQQKSSQLRFEDTQLQLQNELNKYYNDYLTSLQLLKIQQTNVLIAQKDVDIAVGRLRLGNISDIDLRITQQKLIDAENNLLSAQYSAKQAEIELQRLSGNLLKVME